MIYFAIITLSIATLIIYLGLRDLKRKSYYNDPNDLFK